MISALLIYTKNLPEIINLLKRFKRPKVSIKNLITSVKMLTSTKDYKRVTSLALKLHSVTWYVTYGHSQILKAGSLTHSWWKNLQRSCWITWNLTGECLLHHISLELNLALVVSLICKSVWLSFMADAATVCAPCTFQGNYKNEGKITQFRWTFY